ncbi:MAG: apolipoprotein N-acyltransferase [Pseudomonadota bacterium]
MGADAASRPRPSIRHLLPFLAGAVAALGLAPFSLPLLTVAALAVFFGTLTLKTVNPRAAARAGFLFGLGYFLVALHWIVQPFFVDAARHGWMAPFALAGLAGGMALFWAAGLWAATKLAGRAGPVSGVLGLGLAEMVRSGFLGGFPWALIGSVWVDSPARAAAAWIGVHGLTLLTLGLAAGLAAAVGTRSRAGGALALFCAAALAGAALIAPPPVTPGPDALRVRVVQANAAQHLKWRSDMIPVFWERHLQLTSAPSDRPPDVTIWPEVSMPYLAGTNPEADGGIAAAANGATVLVGAQRRDQGGLFNSLVAIDPDGETAAIYDKHHLVPFGEYFPGGALAARLGFTGLATNALGAFTSGPGPQVLDLTGLGLGRVAPLICYEAIFPRYGRVALPRADWIVQVTNDAWFGDFAGPQQHLDLARLRAVEQGLPLVRAANTGISAVIGPDGHVLGEIALDTAGYLDVDLPAPLPPTGYARLGPAPVWAVLAVLAALLLMRRRQALTA